MESLVDIKSLDLLYAKPKDRVFASPPRFHILCTHYKTPQYLSKCLESLFSQSCSIPFEVHLVDDKSDMPEVENLLDEWAAKEPTRLHVYRNKERKNKGRNLFFLLDNGTFEAEDVLGIVDGDDWLATPNALERVVEEYKRSGCWMTYGSYACSDGKTGNCTIPLSAVHLACEARGRGFREAPWIFSHFFTAKAFLWKAVPRDLLNFNGTIEDGGAPDQIFNIPIAEMASSQNISNISEILYIYNNQSTLNEFVVRPQQQLEYDQKNRQRPAAKPIQRPALDFLMILPCRGRFPLLNATLQRLKEESNSRAQVLLVEHSENPTYKEYALEQGIGWMYIPMSPLQTSPFGQFNRGLCFDIGVLHGLKANFYICHDNDLLVPVDFWKLLRQNLERSKTQVLQTYSDRFVWQTTQETSQRLLDEPSWFHSGFTLDEHCTRNHPGAKGGSLTISRDAYFAVGGHDPHLFFGYAAEDSFFWSKLELLFPIGFGEDPRLPLVHLWHPCAASQNPFKHHMDVMFHMFNSLPVQQKMAYVVLKSNQFQRVAT